MVGGVGGRGKVLGEVNEVEKGFRRGEWDGTRS